MRIINLNDLNKFKTAPELNISKKERLLSELDNRLIKSDWITVGVMASSDYEAIKALKSLIQKYTFIKFKRFEDLRATGSVFLKGNQKTGSVYMRSENGLGEGILLTCQYDEKISESTTIGPLPLNFFSN